MVDGVNKIVTKVEELGMFDVLESLQYHLVEVFKIYFYLLFK